MYKKMNYITSIENDILALVCEYTMEVSDEEKHFNNFSNRCAFNVCRV
jgi:hypothetical protein